MLKSKKLLLTPLFFLLFILTVKPTPVAAETCSSFQLSYTKSFPTTVSCSNIPTSATVTVNSGSNQFSQGATYTLMLASTYNALPVVSHPLTTAVASSQNSITFTYSDPEAFESGTWFLIIHGPELGAFPPGCSISGSSRAYTVSDEDWSAEVYVTQTRSSQTCYGYPSGCLEAGTPASLIVQNVKLCGQPYANKNINIFLENNLNTSSRTNASGTPVGSPFPITLASPGIYSLRIGSEGNHFDDILSSNINISAANSCTSCQTTPPIIATGERQEYKICNQISDSLDGGAAKQSCIDCVGGELGREGIWTAVGCIPRNPEKIVNSILRIGLGVGGGFSLIIILVSGFVLSVSQGEPKRIDEAKQWLTSALVGLLFIIFSVTILHFIGYTIFKIPGFGG